MIPGLREVMETWKKLLLHCYDGEILQPLAAHVKLSCQQDTEELNRA